MKKSDKKSNTEDSAQKTETSYAEIRSEMLAAMLPVSEEPMIRTIRLLVSSLVLVAAFLLAPLVARAQDAGVTAALVAAGGDGGDAGATPADAAVESDAAPTCQAPVLGGYAEVFGAVTNEHTADGTVSLRGFDNRVGTVALSNVALSAQFRCGNRTRGWGHVGLDATIQFAGTTAPTYYGSEAGDWRFIQQLVMSWRRDTNVDEGRYWLLEGGVFLSPIGPEGMQASTNWNWSRSNLFFGFPFYHAGIQLTRGLTPRWRISSMVFNGWNNIVDNNDEKSFHLRAIYEVADRITWTGQVMTGVERPPSAPEGRAWRSMFDTFVTWHANDWLSVQLHGNVGIEPNNLGTAWWAACAAYVRVRPWPTSLPGLTFAGRWDAFYERTPEGGGSIFWPTTPGRPGTLMSSGTITGRLEIASHAAVYLEGRGDYSDGALWIRSQTATETVYMHWRWTATLGLTAWF